MAGCLHWLLHDSGARQGLDHPGALLGAVFPSESLRAFWSPSSISTAPVSSPATIMGACVARSRGSTMRLRWNRWLHTHYRWLIVAASGFARLRRHWRASLRRPCCCARLHRTIQLVHHWHLHGHDAGLHRDGAGQRGLGQLSTASARARWCSPARCCWRRRAVAGEFGVVLLDVSALLWWVWRPQPSSRR